MASLGPERSQRASVNVLFVGRILKLVILFVPFVRARMPCQMDPSGLHSQDTLAGFSREGSPGVDAPVPGKERAGSHPHVTEVSTQRVLFCDVECL